VTEDGAYHRSRMLALRHTIHVDSAPPSSDDDEDGAVGEDDQPSLDQLRPMTYYAGGSHQLLRRMRRRGSDGKLGIIQSILFFYSTTGCCTLLYLYSLPTSTCSRLLLY
jgi:hypothetical protein